MNYFMKLRIKEILHAANIKQNKAAEMMNMQPGYLSELANGKKRANTDFIDNFCSTFKVEPYELFVDPKLVPDERDVERISRFHASEEHVQQTIDKHLGVEQCAY